MPRQDVPYGGAICRLKERIAEIWDELGKKLHSINGVEGDAAGDVKIVSGDAAVVVTSDQVNHEITIGLDQTELPSAAVTSVNGRTGDVILHSSDINADGGISVQGALDNLSTRVTANASNIGAEATARQNADATLQGNINSVQASIPGAAATAVANDPTVAQLATDVPNKLDKISSGSSLKAYTHTGATQGETSVVDGTTANSIGVRDANGRMQAADPASGATDKTLVTANWVSQTGMGRPNNLLHDSGNETFSGIKTNDGGRIIDLSSQVKNTSGATDFCPIYKVSSVEMHIALITYIRGGDVALIKVDANASAITKAVIVGTMNNRLGIFTDPDGNRFLCCELNHNSAISTIGMIGQANAGFTCQLWAIVGSSQTGSSGLTQIAVTP